MKRIPLMLIPYNKLKGFSRKFHLLGEFGTRFFPGIEYDIKAMDSESEKSEYGFASIFNAFLYSIIFMALLFVLNFYTVGRSLMFSILVSLGISFGLFILFSFLLLRYPRIYAGKRAEHIEKNLVFALKDLLLQVSSGTSLYNGLLIISKSDYGGISEEFGKIAKKINAGMPIQKALENLSIETRSDYLKRALWQLMNTIKAGASLREALVSLIEELTSAQRTKISNYAKELNLWSLLYLLFAVAIPTIGIVFLLILGSFSGFNVTKWTFVIFLGIDVLVQIAIIGFIKSRRPVVQF